MDKPTKQWSTLPKMGINPQKTYTATFKTEKGDIVCALYASKVPKTVNNFVFLARDGFYDNTIFHRVITDFMAQGGDPTATGMGGPGYKFNDEFNSTLRHNGPGILSMANSGPNSNGSQFFITHVPTPWLDNKHTVFGQVIKGLDVLFSIPARNPSAPEYQGVKIETIVIEES
jgi:cyclophilin family peptidyl-prolyl cis-trans isomerase